MLAWESFSPEYIQTPQKSNSDDPARTKPEQKQKLDLGFKLSYKDMEEPNDSFVGQYVQDISRLWINDWQSVDLVF